jgi:hypothetical protein
VGDGWKPSELRTIAHTLLGTWAPVAAPQQLVGDFRAVLTAAMAKRVTGVLLRITPKRGTKVSYFAQVMPSIEDLTGKRVVSGDEETCDFPLGDWGDQVRDYHLRLEADQRAWSIGTGEGARLAKLEILLPSSDEKGGTPPVPPSASLAVQWTTDVSLSGRINRRVGGYTGQEEEAVAVDEALAAWRDGGADAEAKVGRAVRLAHQLQREDLLERFTAIAEFVDPAAGIVRLRRYEQVSRVNEIWASYLSEQSRLIDPDGDDDPDRRGDG